MKEYDDQGLPDEAFTETEREAGVPDIARGHSGKRRKISGPRFPPDYEAKRKPGGIQAAIAGALRFQTFDEARAWAMQNPGSSFVPDAIGEGYRPSKHHLARNGTMFLSRVSATADIALISYMFRHYCPHLLRYWEHNDRVDQFSEVAVNSSLARFSPEAVHEFSSFLLDFRDDRFDKIEELRREWARRGHDYSIEIARYEHFIAVLDRAIRCAKQFC